MTVGVLAAGIGAGMLIGWSTNYLIRILLVDKHQQEVDELKAKIEDLQEELGKRSKAGRHAG